MRRNDCLYFFRAPFNYYISVHVEYLFTDVMFDDISQPCPSYTIYVAKDIQLKLVLYQLYHKRRQIDCGFFVLE